MSHATFLSAPRTTPAPRRGSARRRCGLVALAALLAIGVADGASARGNKTRNTLIGAGIGAAGGALLTNGDVWGTLGGAAAGGLIGNVLTDDHHHRGRDWDRRRGYDRRYDRRRYPHR